MFLRIFPCKNASVRRNLVSLRHFTDQSFRLKLINTFSFALPCFFEGWTLHLFFLFLFLFFNQPRACFSLIFELLPWRQPQWLDFNHCVFIRRSTDKSSGSIVARFGWSVLLEPATLWSWIERFNPFQPSAVFHIETSLLFCRALQMIGFYMKRNTGLKWVNLMSYTQLVTLFPLSMYVMIVSVCQMWSCNQCSLPKSIFK